MSRARTRPAPTASPAPESRPPRRGDILWVSCDPSVGVQPRKTRTCVVVSNDVSNEHGLAITVAPTSAYSAERAARGYMVDLRKPRSTLAEARVANASMVMTYDKSRIVALAGRAHADAMVKLDAALALHLGLRGI
jgi:mRNA interferase MazF